MLPPIERRFEDNPTIIRTQNRHLAPAASEDLTRPSLGTILYCKIQHFSLRLSPKMSRSAAPVTKSHPPTFRNTAPATQNEYHPLICVTYETSFPMRGASKVTRQPHQILRLPRNLEAQDFSGNSLNASANRKTIRG